MSDIATDLKVPVLGCPCILKNYQTIQRAFHYKTIKFPVLKLNWSHLKIMYKSYYNNSNNKSIMC